MNEKRIFLIFLIVVAILLGIAATVAYIEDPGHIFTEGYETGIANILLSGQNAANIENYDERLLQKEIIQNDQRHIDMIVLGSSRSMQINSQTINDIFTDQIFFNHCVSGASIEDYIAILELYFEKNALPSTIILGVDPWILNSKNDQDRWKSLRNEYENGVERISAKSIVKIQDFDDIDTNIDPYLSLISRPIIIKSLQQLLSSNGNYYSTNFENLNVAIRLKDGTISYPESFKNKTVEQINRGATNYANNDPIYSLGRFTQIDSQSKFLFESTIQYLQKRNTTIVLFLPPYHPIVSDKLTTDPQYSMVKEAESYFREFALSENITVIGSYDPNILNLSSTDFYDGMHPTREAIDKILLESW